MKRNVNDIASSTSPSVDEDMLHIVNVDNAETVCEQLSDEEILASDLDLSSDLAKSVKRLKKAVISQAQKRDTLPRELFWSLFYSQIRGIRESRDKKRLLRRLEYGLDW